MSLEDKITLMKMKPQHGVLGLLDLIFDFLSFEDLEKMAVVCKLFCYAATLDRLYDKYEIPTSTKN